MKVKITKEYYDKKEKRYPVIGEILDVSDERAEQLINAGYAVNDDTEPQSSDTYAVKDEPEYYRKSKRNRGVDGWTNDQ